jgi:hypothetical protein
MFYPDCMMIGLLVRPEAWVAEAMFVLILNGKGRGDQRA